MGINRESDIAANLQIGPTSLGMVRLYVEAGEVELPLDFEPDEAEEIAEELRAAAAKARTVRGGAAGAGGKATGKATTRAPATKAGRPKGPAPVRPGGRGNGRGR
jgi:hypothetical protein